VIARTLWTIVVATLESFPYFIDGFADTREMVDLSGS